MADAIAMIGFGEAGRAVAQGWGREVCARLSVFDVKSEGPQAGEIAAACSRAGAACARDRAAALAGAAHVVCLVTADQAVAAARQCAPFLAPGAFWFDGNSCSPDAKREAARAIGAAGGRYVDMAIMAPIHPRLHKTPLLIAGPQEAADFLDAQGMEYRRLGEEIGSASAVKMIRSVMVKGVEALTAECLLAARRAGVVEEVLSSLQASDPRDDWRRRGNYNLERMMTHGVRRAAEMREVAATLAALGLPARMAQATVAWQDEIGALGLRHLDAGLDERLDKLDDAGCWSATSAI